MMNFDEEDDPMVSIAKALHRIADALENVTGPDGTFGSGYITINLEPSDCEALRVKLENAD